MCSLAPPVVQKCLRIFQDVSRATSNSDRRFVFWYVKLGVEKISYDAVRHKWSFYLTNKKERKASFRRLIIEKESSQKQKKNIKKGWSLTDVYLYLAVEQVWCHGAEHHDRVLLNGPVDSVSGHSLQSLVVSRVMGSSAFFRFCATNAHTIVKFQVFTFCSFF